MNLNNLTPLQQKTLEAYPAYDKFLKDYNPPQLLAVYDDIKTIGKSVLQQRLSIADVCRIYNTEKFNAGVDYIDKWLQFVNRFSNINKPLTETRTVAFMIYNEFNHLFFSDLKVLFEKLMRGEYGSFYGSVDAQRVLTAFSQYNAQRIPAAKTIHNSINAAVNQYSEQLRNQLIAETRDRLAEDFTEEAHRKLFYERLPELDEKIKIYRENYIKSLR